MKRETLNAADISIRYHKSADEFHTDSPIVAAAFEIAKKAHAPQPRGKADKSIPYIIHPIMVHDLLYSHGVRDEIALAAALLHDAREDCDAYLENPDLMRQELETALKRNQIIDSTEIAAVIDGICGELTNDSSMEEGKRTWQVEHAGRISRRGAELKILDQMASVLDGIMEPDDAEFPAEKKRRWNYKALNVVKSAAGDSEGLQYWKDLFKVLLTYQMTMIDHPEREAQMREEFDFSKAVQTAIDYPRGKPDAEIVRTVLHRDAHMLARGCLSVSLTEAGEVAGYSILSNPTADRHDLKNEASIQLSSVLETTDDKRRVTVGPNETLEGRLVRNVKVKPPLDIAAFNRVAKDCNTIGSAFATDIQDASRGLTNGRTAG